MNSRKSKNKVRQSVLIAELLLLSAGTFAATKYLQRTELTAAANGKARGSEFAAEMISAEVGGVSALTSGGCIERLRGVTVTSGEGYVRFNVTLLDSDGVPLSEKLAQKREDIEVFKEYTKDPEMPSFEAFNDEYYNLQNEYDLLKLKADAALAAFTLSRGGSAFDSDEYVCVKSDDGCSCTLLCKEKLCEGETAELYGRISLPEKYSAEYDNFVKNEDNSYRVENFTADAEQLLGSGFGIRVSCDAVSAEGAENVYAAFEIAQD